MADRQANINVNYNINTQQVQAAQQTVNRAQQATDSFRKSVGDVGSSWRTTSQQFLSNGTKVASTIDGMRIQMQQLRAQIELTSKADTKRLQTLSKDYQTVKKSIDDMNASLGATQKTTNATTMSFQQFVGAVRTFIAAALVKELIETNLELAKMAGQFEGVERAFKRLPNSTRLLDDLRKATHGTVNDLELMQQALRANNFEIDLKQLGKLLEFAATRAQQTGQEVDYLVNSIVMGIGMKSILRLDNLGLSATRLKEELGGVSVKAASVAEITRVVAKVADESQKKLGGYFETSATKVDQLLTKYKELKLELSKNVENSGFIRFLTILAEQAELRLESWRKGLTVQELTIQKMQEEKAMTADLEFEKQKLGKSREEDISTIEDEIFIYQKRVNEYDKEITRIKALIELKENEKKINEQLYKRGDFDAGARNKKLSEEIAVLNTQISEIEARGNAFNVKRLELLKQRLDALVNGNNEEIKNLGLVEEYLDKIEDLEERIKKARKSTNAETRAQILVYQKEIDGLQEKVDKLLGTFNEFGTLQVGTDKLKQGTQLAKIGATIDSFAVPATTMEKLINDLNEKFKKNPPKIVAEPGSESQWKEAWDGFLNQGMPTIIASDIIGDQIKSVMDAEVDAYDRRIKAAERFYDRQAQLAGEKYSDQTEAEKQRQKELDKIEQDRVKTTDRLRREQAEKEIKARRVSVIVDTAAGIARAFATAATIPRAIIQAAIVAAYGASQLAIVNRQRANFATGVLNLKGPGTETSDSIPANLSKGESVMTAKETKSSLGILKAIRAKKLDDKVLEQIKSGRAAVASTQFSDKGIIKAIKDNKPPDYIEKHGMLYKVYQKEANFRTIQRSKAMGK